MNPRRLMAAKTALFVILVASSGGCERAPDPTKVDTSRPNVVVITVDTLRADRLGCYGFEAAQTPHIDKLASQGVRAEHAIAATPVTLPSHTSIFTGLNPPAHGVRDNGLFHVADEAQTLAERLKAEGYRTQAFVSAMVLHKTYNLDQGFDGYDDRVWSQLYWNEDQTSQILIQERPGERTMELVLEWLDSAPGSQSARTPFFLWVHLFEPHAPYMPLTPEVRAAPTLYDGEIARADIQVGRLVEKLGQMNALEDTILVFTSDHGESLGEHGEETHALFIYESTVRVPMIIRYPRKLPAGKVYEAPVRHVDIMPTILELAGVQPSNTEGQDLSAAFAGATPPPSFDQYSESLHPQLEYGMAPLHGIRADEWTYIRAPRPELYNRDKDPNETRNLLELSPREIPDVQAVKAAETQAAKLDERLTKVLEASTRFGLTAEPAPLDQATIDMLKALGYMADDDAKRGIEGMDPKDGIEIYSRVNDALQLLHDHKYVACTDLIESLLKQMPGNVTALNTAAICEHRLGNVKAAEQYYLKSLAAEPRQHFTLVELGRISLADGRRESARARFLEALKVVPGSVEALSLLGYLELLVRAPEEAKRWFEQAIGEDPDYPQAHVGYGDLYLAQGDYTKAKSSYDRAVELQPRNSHSWLQGGVCALRMGDLQTAERYVLRAAELKPAEWQPHYLAAVARVLAGDSDTALAHLEQALKRGFPDPAALLNDKNLAALQGDPRLERLARERGGQ